MEIDWHAMLVPTVSLIELVIRGSAIFLFLFVLLRVLVRRHIGTLSLTDLLVIVLIADAAQNAMASEYRSVPEGFVLCGTIIAWSYVFDWVAFRYKWLRPLIEPAPLPLIRSGKLLRRNMREELISLDELMSHLRQNGIESVDEVDLAYLEPDGQISVIKAQKQDDGQKPRKSAGVS